MENGTYVSRAEMLAHLDPLVSDVAEVKRDMKTLLRRDAGRVAITNFFWKSLGIVATLSCGILTGIILQH